MRHIHPVGIHEKFVASGRYYHHANATTYWSIHELPDGAWLIRLDQDGRQAHLPSLLIEAWRTPLAEGGKIARFDLWGYGDKTNHIQQVKGRYFVTDTSLDASIQINNQSQQTHTLHLVDDVVVMPDVPFFWGLAVNQMQTQGNCGTIFTCNTNFDALDGFMPLVYPQSITFVDDGVLDVLNKVVKVQIFQFGDVRHISISRDLGITIMTKDEKAGSNIVELEYTHRPMKG